MENLDAIFGAVVGAVNNRRFRLDHFRGLDSAVFFSPGAEAFLFDSGVSSFWMQDSARIRDTPRTVSIPQSPPRF
jgi:hypothetical protein